MNEQYSKYKLDAIVEIDADTKRYAPSSKSFLRKKYEASYSRRNLTCPVMDQGHIGSCVGASGKAVFSDSQYRDVDLSALFIYHNAKKYDAWRGESYSGTSIAGAFGGIKSHGVCKEELYPYELKENAPIPQIAYDDGMTRLGDEMSVMRASETMYIKDALRQQPLWTSFYVHKEFFTANKNGFITNESNYLLTERRGAHAVAITGWKTIDGKLFWEFQNSWGRSFGDNGFFYMGDDLFKKVSWGVYKPLLKGTPNKLSTIDKIKLKIKKFITGFVSFVTSPFR